MAPPALGKNKIVAYKKQSALGTPAAGAGGQKLRRRTSMIKKAVASYDNDEIVSHQQSTGSQQGPATPNMPLSGVLSPGTYAAMVGSLLRRDFAAITALTALSLTIASSGGGVYTITRGSGDFLAAGLKAGMVARLTAGAFNAANLNKNILIVSLTATVLTVQVLNKVALVAEGPIASATLAIPGKVTFTPMTGHTNDYYTFEDWYADLSKSETLVDAKPVRAQLNVPATGNATVDIEVLGLNRVRGTSQVLTSPTAETGTDPLGAVFGLVMCNGAVVGSLTGAQLTIDGRGQHGDPVLGSNLTDDIVLGDVAVSGQITVKFVDTSLQDIFDQAATTSVVLVLAEDLTATADFISIIIPLLGLFGDDPDDGKKQIIRTYPIVAKINTAGGSGVSSEATIIEIQDSAA